RTPPGRAPRPAAHEIANSWSVAPIGERGAWGRRPVGRRVGRAVRDPPGLLRPVGLAPLDPPYAVPRSPSCEWVLVFHVPHGRRHLVAGRGRRDGEARRHNAVLLVAEDDGDVLAGRQFGLTGEGRGLGRAGLDAEGVFLRPENARDRQH